MLLELLIGMCVCVCVLVFLPKVTSSFRVVCRYVALKKYG